MGARQIAEMEPGVREVYEGLSGPDDAPTACCTFEASTPEGSAVWIQAMPGNINMAYPLTDEPLELLRARGVRSPSDMYLVEWEAGRFAAFGFDFITPRDHATFVDQLFVKVLGCDDEGYEPKASIEQLET